MQRIFRTILTTPVSHWRAILWSRRQLIDIDHRLREAGLSSTKQYLLELDNSKVSVFSGHEVKDIVRAIRRAERVSIGNHDSCLRRSLLLWWILKRQGMNAQLRTGVTSNDGVIEGHAWVELDHVPIADRRNIRDTFKVIETEFH